MNWLNTISTTRKFFIVLTSIWAIIFIGINFHSSDVTALSFSYAFNALVIFIWGMWWTFKDVKILK